MTENLSLVALAPGDLAATQQTLGDWCVQKIAGLRTELADLKEHLLIASGNGWKLRGLTAAITRVDRRITYYDKIKTAVAAGYLIVPNFPMTVVAVRVARETQPEATSDYEHNFGYKDARAQLLPVGEGRYVDETLFYRDESHDEPDGKGGTKKVRKYVSGDYDEPAFPFAAVKALKNYIRWQGLPDDFLSEAPFTVEGKVRVVGNGVPLPMGRAVAAAVKRAMYPELEEESA